ncbi:protein kinase [Nocardia sp. NPDC004860]|uniref:serine/threonine-protein kinase n=1 Tax=Nocardia sp. NPDC004860 TaxID=3154557 RepID=UPI0033A0B5F4
MLNSGDVFAGFTIERLLGQGGMGSVYLARHPRLGKLTALKLLNRELYADREIRARFEREADLVARLDHPNIVEVYDRGTEDEMLWISMQYVDGVDAAGINVATLPPERAVQVIEGVASALDYAHGMGVLHRDVKPANIILARAVAGHGERVFLTDFGIARLREDSTHLTQAGMFTATLAYASPEQMTGAHLDPTTDQYSLACALYWLLIGAGPYDSPHPAELIRGHLQLLPPPVSLRRPGLSPAMDAVLTKAMAKRPADRFPTCTDFAKAARRALSGPPAQHPVHQQPLHPAYPNLPAPQPNYAPQPYPGQAYPAPPQPYPATALPPQPAAYPSPPQQPPAPNYPAPQPQSAPPASQQPVSAPGYPPPAQSAGPQPQAPAPAAAPTYAAPAYPPPPYQSSYPAPAPQAPAPEISQQPPADNDRAASGPTARPYPPTQGPAAGYSAPPQPQSVGVPGYPAPQGQPMPPAAGVHEPAAPAEPTASAGSTAGTGRVAGPELPGAPIEGSPAPQAVPDVDPTDAGWANRPPDVDAQDASQRPTDVVPQPVISAGQPEEFSTGGAAGPAVSDTDGPEQAGSAAAKEDSSGSAGGGVSEPWVAGETSESDSGEQGLGGAAGSPGFEEILVEQVTVLAQPVAAEVVPPATLGGSAIEPTAAVGEGESAGAPPGVMDGAGEMWVGEPIRGGEASESARTDSGDAGGTQSGAAAEMESGAAAGEVESGAAGVGAADSGGAEDESGGVSRHRDSGAFVPGEAGISGGTDGASGARSGGGAENVGGPTFDSAWSEFAAYEQVSGGVADMPGSESSVAGMPGYGGYGGMAQGGPGYGVPPYPGNPVRPGLIPTSQRAEASQLTAVVVLGLAVVALVLLVVVAIVVVSG